MAQFSERSLTLAVGIRRVEIEGKLMACILQEQQQLNKHKFDPITVGGYYTDLIIWGQLSSKTKCWEQFITVGEKTRNKQASSSMF